MEQTEKSKIKVSKSQSILNNSLDTWKGRTGVRTRTTARVLCGEMKDNVSRMLWAPIRQDHPGLDAGKTKVCEANDFQWFAAVCPLQTALWLEEQLAVQIWVFFTSVTAWLQMGTHVA